MPSKGVNFFNLNCKASESLNILCLLVKNLLLIFYCRKLGKSWIEFSRVSLPSKKLFRFDPKKTFFVFLHRPFKCLTLLIIVRNLSADNYQISFSIKEKNRCEKKISLDGGKFFSFQKQFHNFLINIPTTCSWFEYFAGSWNSAEEFLYFLSTLNA